MGLAKLGLFDLSLKHVSISATPWENPLYRFRARLSFPPVHSSVRSLAQAVDSFEQQGEALLLLRSPSSKGPVSLMTRICNSLNEAALALQALPLLHLAGYSSPRYGQGLGHSPVALPVLLGEVLQAMCPPNSNPSVIHPIKGFVGNSNNTNYDAKVDYKKKKQKITKIKIGFMSGSFDGAAGYTVIALVEGLTAVERATIKLTALSFPTPRDATTDRVNALFDDHVNLNPMNKSQAISRVLDSHVT